eukprot:12924857-Alexandrium_andersonii.AAC.1
MSESTPTASRSAARRGRLTAAPRSCATWSSASPDARLRGPPGQSRCSGATSTSAGTAPTSAGRTT